MQAQSWWTAVQVVIAVIALVLSLYSLKMVRDLEKSQRVSQGPKPKMVCAVDVSGSISPVLIDTWKKIINGYRDHFDVTVLTFTDQIEQVFNSETWPKLAVNSRGGTDYRCIFGWITNHFEGTLEQLNIYTDGCGTFPELEATRGLGKVTTWWVSDEGSRIPEGLGQRAYFNVTHTEAK